ncbi:MAG: DUF3800 domain-containing protein [Thermodesulfobacteriota bacterium]
MNLYVDESIHNDLGFIVSAFVIAEDEIDSEISSALIKAGLVPGKEEFKSGARMSGNLSLQNLRQDLFGIIREHCRVAFMFTAEKNRKNLGIEAIEAMQKIFRKNGISPAGVAAHFDEGMFPSVRSAINAMKKYPELNHLQFHPEQNSKNCLGIQLADALANSMSQIVREAITGKPKFINIGGESSGYPDDTEAELGWTLLMGIRYNFYSRPVLPHGYDFDPKTDPLIYSDNEDPVDVSINPELIGWGIHLGNDLPKDVKETVEKRLDRIWLGCIH